MEKIWVSKILNLPLTPFQNYTIVFKQKLHDTRDNNMTHGSMCHYTRSAAAARIGEVCRAQRTGTGADVTSLDHDHQRMVQVEDPSPASAPAPAPVLAPFSPAAATPGQSRQAQCWPSGICRCTDATWRPQPAHVDLPHVPHFTW
jgi:hypothetical protein